MNQFRQSLVALAVVGAVGLGIAAGSSGAGASRPDRSERLTAQQRNIIREQTRQYRDVDVALAAGYLPTDVCVEEPGIGGMGYHYLNPAYAMDDVIDTAKPEVLVYQKGSNGKLRLGAVEYFRADADQDLDTDTDRPYLFDQYPFVGPMDGHEPGMPVHFDLHVWLYRHNPAGELASFNPMVSCTG